MTQFWRLFTSDYVQDFVDRVSMPTSDELLEMFGGSQFEEVLENYRRDMSDMLEQIPSFEEIYVKVKSSIIDQLEKNK